MFILYGFMIVAVITDLRFGKISNRLILTGIGVALIRRLLQEGCVGLLTGVIQISFPVIILYLFFLIGALGAGDIKLFSLVGGFVNFRELVTCIMAAFVLGAVWALVKLLISRRLFCCIRSGSKYLWSVMGGDREGYRKTSENTIPFSVVILGGLIVAVCCC